MCWLCNIQEGVTLTTESFSQLSQDSSVMAHRDFDEQSKVDKLLGGGKGWKYILLYDTFVFDSAILQIMHFISQKFMF